MFKRFALFYALTLLFTFVLGGIQQATGLGVPEAGTPRFILPQWAPALGALVTLLIFRRDLAGGLPPRLRPSLRRDDAGRLLAAFALPLLAALPVALLVGRLIEPVDWSSAAGRFSVPAAIGLLFGAVGEELGWRGYLQPLVQTRWRPLAASLLVGIVWALWHVQLYANGPLYMLFLTLTLDAYSVTITAVSGGSRLTWPAVLFHCAVNVANLFFLSLISDTLFMALNAAVWAVIAALAAWLRRPVFFGTRPTSKPVAEGSAPA
jgi:membrane protease YdiL (CAAX protease family)